ncbi:MAG TPA: universal stress protein [Gemmatimonadaceae bacterium]|nr:universal stress protein [Gemmatimonadaceae bacterium]
MLLSKILIGVDFSEASVAAARWTATCFAPWAELVLAHVIPPAEHPRFAAHLVPPPEQPAGTDAAVAHATAMLGEIARLARTPAPRQEIRTGKPHEELAALADAIGADLIAVGAHGESHHASRFLGTTADRLVRTARIPVLVAASPALRPIRTLLVAVEDADITPRVLEWAHALADAHDAAVTLLHVWSNAAYSHVASMSYATAGNAREAEVEIAKELRAESVRWLEQLAKTGVPHEGVTSAVRFGHPGDCIVTMARQIEADLIVIGRHGTGAAGPELLGRTVRAVLHEAHCPVLVVAEASEGGAEHW